MEASKGFCFRPGEGMVGKSYSGLLPSPVEFISDMREACPTKFFRKHEALLAGIECAAFFVEEGRVYEFGYESTPEKGLTTKIVDFVNRQRRVGSRTQVRRTSSIATDSTADMSSTILSCGSPRSRTESSSADFTVGDCDPETITSVSCTPPRTRSPSPANAHEGWPSPGSVGHPYACKAPCRFQHRGKGCKDGSKCDKCHLCRFTRAVARQKGVQKP